MPISDCNEIQIGAKFRDRIGETTVTVLGIGYSVEFQQEGILYEASFGGKFVMSLDLFMKCYSDLNSPVNAN